MNLENYNNQYFSQKIASEKIALLMQQLTTVTCRSKISLSLADLEEIRCAKEIVIQDVSIYFDMMIEKMLERRANLLRYKDIRFISLGEDCFCRTVLSHWGLKPTSILGEKSLPFDLAVHPVGSLADIILSDFDGYLDPANLKYLEQHDTCCNTAFNIHFNHEKGVKYAEDHFRLLIDVYNRRINNFRNIFKCEKRIVFIIHICQPRSKTCIQIQNAVDALTERYPLSSILVICINTWKLDEKFDFENRNFVVDDRISFIDVHYPSENYVWFMIQHCFTSEGHMFEKNVISKIKQLVDVWENSLPVQISDD